MSVRIRNAIVIDDEEVNRVAYKRLIERSHLFERVLQFSGGEDALDFFRQPDHPEIDVIFLDINMPRMSGFEFLRAAAAEFRGLFVETFVVMLTTSDDPADEAQAMACDPVKAFFNKPLSRDHLEAVAKMSECRRPKAPRPSRNGSK